MTEIPRRIDLWRLTPAERTIYLAVQAVEAMPADVRLTDAVVLLQAARESVADYVDGNSSRRYVSAPTPEFCICAAILARDLDGNLRIVLGHRHDGAIKYALGMHLFPCRDSVNWQGFMTSTGRYVDRFLAMSLQKAAGKKSVYSADGELHGNILFSEDLH